MSRFHALVIADRRQETPDSVSLAFSVPEGLRDAFAFQPGQYLTVRATIGGEECRRSYSICSAVGEGELRIAVKKVEGGRFSCFANEALRQGAPIDVAPPEGRFTADIGASRHYAFFAAGSGITPVISIIGSALTANAEARATLFYGNRTASSIMFRQALDELKDRHLGRLSVFHVLSREFAGNRPSERPGRRRPDRALRQDHRSAEGCRRLLPLWSVRHDRGGTQGADRRRS